MPHNRLGKSLIYSTLAILISLSTACNAEVAASDTPTPTGLVIITATLPPTQTPRPSATAVPPTPTVSVAPVEGQTTSQLNIRSAPSADSDLLGTVQISTNVQIVGKDPSGTWWLIVHPDSPTGTGWITAQFVLTADTENVPVLDRTAQSANDSPVTVTVPETGPGSTADPGSISSPTSAASMPTQSLATAFEDGDSNQSPAVSIALSKSSVRSFNFNSDLSSPQGDLEDWVQFRLEGQAEQQMNISVVLNCSGSGALRVELLQNNSILQSWQDITCGHPNQLLLSLFVGAPYNLHLTPSQGNSIQKYINYTLIVTLQ